MCFAEFRVFEASLLDDSRFRVAAVAHVRVPPRRQLRQLDKPLKLPSLFQGDAEAVGLEYVTDRPIPAKHIAHVDEWRVTELDDPDARRAFRRDHELITLRYLLRVLQSGGPRSAFRRDHQIASLGQQVQSDGQAFTESRALATAAIALELIHTARQDGRPGAHDADPAVVIAFALLADAGPGSPIGEGLLRERITSTQYANLTAALVLRGTRLQSMDPTISVCLAADQLAAENPDRHDATMWTWDAIWAGYLTLAHGISLA